MSLTQLQDDLLQEFREERNMIKDQVEVLDPIATSLRKPAAQRLISTGGLIALEIICYLLSAAFITVIVLLKKIPFLYLLSDLLYNHDSREKLGFMNVLYLNLAFYGMIGLLVILFYILARMVRRMRLKNNILHVAGNSVKIVVGQILKRKAAIEAIEQRHFIDMHGIQVNPPASVIAKHKVDVNEVLNPGYEEAE